MSIDDLVSKSVNPAQLIDAIHCIIERRSAAKPRQCRTKDRDVDPGIIDEYFVIIKSIKKIKTFL